MKGWGFLPHCLIGVSHSVCIVMVCFMGCKLLGSALYCRTIDCPLYYSLLQFGMTLGYPLPIGITPHRVYFCYDVQGMPQHYIIPPWVRAPSSFPLLAPAFIWGDHLIWGSVESHPILLLVCYIMLCPARYLRTYKNHNTSSIVGNTGVYNTL